jgi:autotransporter translocation and assembly factor TamB
MFGKSTNQLNTTEQVTLEERTGRMARSFALDRVSTAVTRALGAGLGLDMVELEAGKSWKSGNVKIGKYITDDLYLSYQRTFAFDKKDKVIDADRIALEYQIMRSLFLQATNQMYNSGFDLIFKKSWR